MVTSAWSSRSSSDFESSATNCRGAVPKPLAMTGPITMPGASTDASKRRGRVAASPSSATSGNPAPDIASASSSPAVSTRSTSSRLKWRGSRVCRVSTPLVWPPRRTGTANIEV